MSERVGEIISVGVTELHNRTSALMQAVSDGAELEITKRGKLVARMKPDTLYDRLKREGHIREPRVRDGWLPKPIRPAPGVTVSDLLKDQQMPITPWESESS
jgi:prevent-host-death family protein